MRIAAGFSKMADMEQESVAAAFERHVPEHPLPEEIKKMTRDDTVCKFCGVSYLIHNEMKAMEEKLKATLAEMERFRGSVEREKKLIEDMAYKEREMQKLRKDLTAKDEALASLRNDLRVRDDTCTRLQATRAELQEQLGKAIQDSESLRLKHNFLIEGVRSFKTDLGQQKVFLRELRSKVTEQGKGMAVERKQLAGLVTRFFAQETSVVKGLQGEVARLEKDKSTAHKDISALQEKLGEVMAEIATTKRAADSENQLTTEILHLKDQIHTLEADNISLSSRLRTTDMELEQLREQSMSRASEIEKMNRQINTSEKASDASIQRLKRDLEQKENELAKNFQQLRLAREQCESMERTAADLKQKNSTSHWHTTEMEEELKRIRGDCEALKDEREMIITAHQSQIEQLRESFKTRLSDADRWPHKLEEALRNEKRKHLVELETLEAKLKENFVMELEIEKQKHQGLLEKYLAGYKDSDKKMQGELSIIQARHKSEIAEVHRQIAEGKARGRETENSLRREIESLKKIIKDLESRLAKVDTAGDSVSSEWRVKAALIQRDLDETKEDQVRLQQQVDKLKEERAFLEDTVRKECEERFELTEALSETKEELLRLKRPPGGFHSSAGTPRQGNSPLTSAASTSDDRGQDWSRPGSRVTGQRSEEMMLYKKRIKNSVPHPPAKARDGEAVDASNVNIGFEGEKQQQGGKLRGGTLGDSRRRIAEAIGRT